LKNRKANLRKNNDDDDNNSNQNIDETMALRKEQIPSASRRFFLSDFLRPKYGSRPSNSYGQKSHWDTYFGK
jgi:hypothetical protein